MNIEQVKSALRWFVTTFGGGIAGFFVAKGWFTIDQVNSVINSPAILSLSATVIVGIWSMFTHKQSNAVAVVDNIAKQPDSPVKAVITEPTKEGQELAMSLPGNTTVVAGSTKAQEVVQ